MQVVARLHPVQGHQYLTGYNVYVKMTPLCVQWMEKDKAPKLSVFQRLKEIASLNPLSSPKLSGERNHQAHHLYKQRAQCSITWVKVTKSRASSLPI